jgi:flavin reductase (DIM6/NTAB) family NADH-FMN oxidoreductase RutF
MSHATTPDPRALRRALGMYATGITIVTAATSGGGQYVGLTVNSFASVSLDPPLVLWSLARDNPDLAAFKASSHYAINVLSSEQFELCRHFAHKKESIFTGVDFKLGSVGAPVFPESCALFECRNLRRHDGGDHIIFIGRVEHFERHEREPLVFHGGHYRRLKRADPPLD